MNEIILSEAENALLKEIKDAKAIYVPSRKSSDFVESDIEKLQNCKELVYKNLIDFSIKTDFDAKTVHFVFISRE